jgi:PHD/YefM family antitoxin component YafN of YafNO toxin-antitoxin module
MTEMNATKARNNWFKMIDNCLKFNEQIKINTKKGNLILLKEEELEGWKATIELCAIAGMKESLIEGLNTPIDECIKESDELYKI